MADEDLIITIDGLDEPFDTTTADPPKRDDPVRIKVPGRDQNGKKVASTPSGATDDAVADLRGQLTEAQRRTAEAEGRARTAAAQADQARTVVADTRSAAIDTEIASAETESASLKRDLKAAWDAGDFEKATDLQEKIADTRARLFDAKRQKTVMEQDPGVTRPHEGAVREQPRQPERPRQGTEEYRQAVLASIQSSATRAWLENHPDCIDDPVKAAEAGLVHQRALKAGLTPDTPAYFRFAEEQLGYTTVSKSTRQRDDSETNGARRVVESAPVDRGGGSGGGGGGSSPMRVELTRGELENATNGTIVWNKGPGVPAAMIGKPIGAKEMARRKAMIKQGNAGELRYTQMGE